MLTWGTLLLDFRLIDRVNKLTLQMNEQTE